MKKGLRTLLSPKWLAVVIVALAALLAQAYYQSYRDASFSVQYFNALAPAALTLHRDHLLSDPSSLHVLWWEKDQREIPGLSVHHLWMPEVEDGAEPSACGLDTMIKRYNQIAIAQACYLVQQGERSKRVWSVFRLAETLYKGYSIPEARVAEAYEDLLTHPRDAGAPFLTIWEETQQWQIFSNYLSAVVMPYENQWGSQNTKDTDEE